MLNYAELVLFYLVGGQPRDGCLVLVRARVVVVGLVVVVASMVVVVVVVEDVVGCLVVSLVLISTSTVFSIVSWSLDCHSACILSYDPIPRLLYCFSPKSLYLFWT